FSNPETPVFIQNCQTILGGFRFVGLVDFKLGPDKKAVLIFVGLNEKGPILTAVWVEVPTRCFMSIISRLEVAVNFLIHQRFSGFSLPWRGGFTEVQIALSC